MKHSFDLERYILEHVCDSREWHLPFLPPLHLPAFLSLHGVMVVISALILILLFCVFYNQKQRVPTGLTNLLEMFVVFVRDHIAVSHLGEEDGRRMTPLFCTFFFFILILNLMGLIPIFSSATANPNVTAALALITFAVMTVGAIFQKGLRAFWRSFIPVGVPAPLLIVLLPIECVGLLIKTFALAIRLFANLFSGHIIIFSLLGLILLLGMAALPSILLAVLISVLEVAVAFLQAYIFTLLSAIFIGQVYRGQH